MDNQDRMHFSKDYRVLVSGVFNTFSFDTRSDENPVSLRFSDKARIH